MVEKQTSGAIGPFSRTPIERHTQKSTPCHLPAASRAHVSKRAHAKHQDAALGSVGLGDVGFGGEQ